MHEHATDFRQKKRRTAEMTAVFPKERVNDRFRRALTHPLRSIERSQEGWVVSAARQIKVISHISHFRAFSHHRQRATHLVQKRKGDKEEKSRTLRLFETGERTGSPVHWK